MIQQLPLRITKIEIDRLVDCMNHIVEILHYWLLAGPWHSLSSAYINPVWLKMPIITRVWESKWLWKNNSDEMTFENPWISLWCFCLIFALKNVAFRSYLVGDLWINTSWSLRIRFYNQFYLTNFENQDPCRERLCTLQFLTYFCTQSLFAYQCPNWLICIRYSYKIIITEIATTKLISFQFSVSLFPSY